MKQQEQQENNESQLEDLAVAKAKSAEVKGGPIYMKVDGVDGDVDAIAPRTPTLRTS